MDIHPLRPRDQEDAARVAISWLAERHRKGWHSAFHALLDLWRQAIHRHCANWVEELI